MGKVNTNKKGAGEIDFTRRSKVEVSSRWYEIAFAAILAAIFAGLVIIVLC